MKNLIIALLATLIMLSGCIGSSLVRKLYDKDGRLIKSLEVNNLKGMVNTEMKSLRMTIRDGNDFFVVFNFTDSNVTDSPESATAIGDAVTNVMSGGASGLAKEALK